MMRCAKFKKTLSDYLDDNLSERKRIQLEEHLSECPDCNGELAQLRSLSAMLQEAEEVEIPEGYWDNYWHRLSVKLPPIKTRSNWGQGFIQIFQKPIPVVYALLAVLLVGLAVFFSDFYLDSRKAKSPQIAKAPDDAYYRVARAKQPVVATSAAQPQSLEQKIELDRKNAAATEKADGLDLDADGIVKDKEMAAKRGEMLNELAREEETVSATLKPEEPRMPKAKVQDFSFSEEGALRKMSETKAGEWGAQSQMRVREEVAMDEDIVTGDIAKDKREVAHNAPALALVETPAIKEELTPQKEVSLVSSEGELAVERAPALGAKGEAVVQNGRKRERSIERRRRYDANWGISLGEKYAEPYGLIIRVLKLHPTKAKLNKNIPGGTASDDVFLSKLREENSGVNLEPILSSKTVAHSRKETSLQFKDETGDYIFKLIIFPPSDNQKEHRLTYLKKHSTPKPGETVVFDIPEKDSDKNNFVVLVTRFKPKDR